MSAPFAMTGCGIGRTPSLARPLWSNVAERIHGRGRSLDGSDFGLYGLGTSAYERPRPFDLQRAFALDLVPPVVAVLRLHPSPLAGAVPLAAPLRDHPLQLLLTDGAEQAGPSPKTSGTCARLIYETLPPALLFSN